MPNNWELCQLSDACDITMGQSPEGSSINSVGGIEFHQGKICFNDKFLNHSQTYTTSPTKIAEENSVLLCVRAPVGVLNITSRRICIGRGLCSIKPKYEVSSSYWFYLLSSYKPYYESNSTGTTFKAISGNIIKNTPILLPPLVEQNRIVEQIEKQFAILDSITAEL